MMHPVFGAREPGRAYVARPSAYALVVNDAGAIAVVLTSQGWYLPGGGIDPGEDAEGAAVRETREECGLVVEAGARVGEAVQLSYASDHDAWYEKTCTFVAARVVGTAPATEADHALAWMAPGRAIEALRHESHQWAVRRLFGAGEAGDAGR